MKTSVAVIYGGRSGEHEISVRSAESIMAALDPERYTILKYFISKQGRWSPRPISPEPRRNPEIDVVFPVLHGTFGEDGTVQGLLELADLPYVSAGVLASSVGMDKEIAKRLMRDAGVPVVEWYTAAPGVENPFGYPVFVKPANLGSSVGISKAHDAADLEKAIALASQYDTKVLVERAVVGQELECSVLGNEEPEAAIPCEVLPYKEFYDYEDKYLLDKTQFRIPPAVPESVVAEVRSLAVRAYKALGCEIMARVDFLLEAATGKLYVNEINTIPGFTSISMYPKMWAHCGLEYPRLLDQLIEHAIARHRRRSALKYEL